MATRTRSVPHEEDVVGDVRLDDAWAVVEEFSTIVRESGTEEERSAVDLLMRRLEGWGVEHTLHEPELLISLPRGASLSVDGVEYRAKTPSMAGSRPEGLVAPIVYEHSGHARDRQRPLLRLAWCWRRDGQDRRHRGLPDAGAHQRPGGARRCGRVAIAPGEWIHEGICTQIWGSPDLTTWGRQPKIPVASISRAGRRAADRADRGATSEATLVTQHEERWRKIPVLVAEIRGQVEPDRFVLVHGHLDSWHVGVGDNATGDATLLELARVLHEHRDGAHRAACASPGGRGTRTGATPARPGSPTSSRWTSSDNCVVHINCDSPGCRDADVFEDVYWSAEAESFATDAIRDFCGQPSAGRPPLRAGDLSFNNLGLSTFFMLSSTMTAELRAEKGYYAVGGCGGNIEWHTEADTLEIADRERLLRDIRLYAGAAFRAANAPVHPLDFRATVAQLEEALSALAACRRSVDLERDARAARRAARRARRALRGRGRDRLGGRGAADQRRAAADRARARAACCTPATGATGRIRRCTSRCCRSSPPSRRRTASVPEGVLRVELVRARNRLDRALMNATGYARAAVT